MFFLAVEYIFRIVIYNCYISKCIIF